MASGCSRTDGAHATADTHHLTGTGAHTVIVLREAKGLAHPVHVTVGAHDEAIGVDAMKATMAVMDNAGRYPMHETPVALATAIERSLSG
jgi:pimeloyl-ACP methyl ester carboxylesterase